MRPIFDASSLCTDICRTIFVILEVQFHHERGLSETRYFELLFSTWSRLSPYQKSDSAEAPFNLFWILTMILAIYTFWKSYWKLLVKIWVLFGSNIHLFLLVVRAIQGYPGIKLKSRTQDFGKYNPRIFGDLSYQTEIWIQRLLFVFSFPPTAL